MKQLFLHIGFYKTGSTSLQRNLALNADLLRRQGVCYPYAPRAPYTQRWQHVPLAAALPGRTLNWLQPGKVQSLGRAYDKMFDTFASSGCSRLVLSSEGFCDADVSPKMLEWLKAQFTDFDITIVAYIRRQDTYFLSTYQEMIKTGSDTPLRFENYATANRLYFAQRLAPWRTAFGTERVKVRPFTPQFWPEGELFYDFLNLIGAERDGLTLTPPENEGLDYRAVELLRQLNRVNRLKSTHRTGAGRLAKICDTYFATRGEKRKMQLSSAQANHMREHFRAENQAALIGSGIDVETFFPAPPPGQTERLIPDTLSPDLLLNLLWDQLPVAAPRQKKKAKPVRRKPKATG
jgi:hypothetical protein